MLPVHSAFAGEERSYGAKRFEFEITGAGKNLEIALTISAVCRERRGRIMNHESRFGLQRSQKCRIAIHANFAPALGRPHHYVIAGSLPDRWGGVRPAADCRCAERSQSDPGWHTRYGPERSAPGLSSAVLQNVLEIKSLALWRSRNGKHPPSAIFPSRRGDSKHSTVPFDRAISVVGEIAFAPLRSDREAVSTVESPFSKAEIGSILVEHVRRILPAQRKDARADFRDDGEFCLPVKATVGLPISIPGVLSNHVAKLRARVGVQVRVATFRGGRNLQRTGNLQPVRGSSPEC